jgi:hypothetical protein
MKKIILLTLALIPILVNSQDLIIFKNGKELNCQITKVDSVGIYYNLASNDGSIQSYVEKKELRSYQIKSAIDSTYKSKQSNNNNLVIIDSAGYRKAINKWDNLITYSKKYGTHANGWSLKYYGYVPNNKTPWIFPFGFEIENFVIKRDFNDRYDYKTAKINYSMFGISPYGNLNDYFYINAGMQLLFGKEQIIYGSSVRGDSNEFIYGISLSQGLYFIPKSKFGITYGIGLFEKFLHSKIYPRDFGIRLEIGIKI